MSEGKDDVRLGHFISLVLRHQPEAAGISLDEHGWADVKQLLAGINATGRHIDMSTLERIVRENDKRRYSFNEDHTKIRANQGHSLPVDVELKKATPPVLLYHGTAKRFVGAICAQGIQKRSRQYVHLSDTYETALKVGARHGDPAVLTLDAEEMVKDGMTFYRSENGVWLCDYVPPKYILGIGQAEDSK